MLYYLAPLEGITTYVFRRAYAAVYGEADRYFTPFLASKKLNSREKNEILPEHNEGIFLVPQILANRTDTFAAIAGQIADRGYSVINLNLGCPSGTVVSHGRGAGMLADPDSLDACLEEAFHICEGLSVCADGSGMRLSVKTRIGIASETEWEALLPVFARYPFEELILHPRLQQQQYGGHPSLEAYAAALEVLKCPVCYNGDICSPADEAALLSRFPQTTRIMTGRGILKIPDLIGRLKGTSDPDRPLRPDPVKLKTFLAQLTDGYLSVMPSEREVLFKLKDLWAFLGSSFEDLPEGHRMLKDLRKSASVTELQNAERVLLQAL